MEELEIKKECLLTWAVNFGEFNNTTFQAADDKSKKTKSTVNAKDSKPSKFNNTKIQKGLEAGKVLAKVKKQGPLVDLWVYLAYKEDKIEYKRNSIRLMILGVYEKYISSHDIKKSHKSKVLLIVLHVLYNILHDRDARFPKKTQVESFSSFKNPSHFTKYYKRYFSDIERIILTLDSKARISLKK